MQCHFLFSHSYRFISLSRYMSFGNRNNYSTIESNRERSATCDGVMRDVDQQAACISKSISRSDLFGGVISHSLRDLHLACIQFMSDVQLHIHMQIDSMKAPLRLYNQ